MLHVLSGLNVESEAVNTESKRVENCSSHQTGLGGGDSTAGTGRVLDLKAGEMALSHAFR